MTFAEAARTTEKGVAASAAVGARDFLRLIAERGKTDEAPSSGLGRAVAERQNPWRAVTLGMFWGGLAAALAAGAYLAFLAGGYSGQGLALAILGAVAAGLFAAGAAMRLLSPGPFVDSLGVGEQGKRRDGGRLAGADMLAALGLAERVLDSDPDARLVSRRDGVVAYANSAYVLLAREAGVMGPAGLPPRLDRLFAQQGAEAAKLFRLCRAAKSAAPADEILYQTIGLTSSGARRRFEVSLRPVPGSSDYVAWRLRELAVEDAEHDAAAAFSAYRRPIVAIEKSGQIAWSNAAARATLGKARGLFHIDDIVLGETGEILRALWRVDAQPICAHVRRRDEAPAEATFVAFQRGGVGEGFIICDVAVETESDQYDPAMLNEVNEAPFGAAVVEGEFGRDAKIVEANKEFTDAFGIGARNAPLARVFPAETLDELAAEIRRKAQGAPRPVEVLCGDASGRRAFELYARPARRKRGGYGARRTLLYTVNVTARKRMEEEHAQDHKLKAIGRLAGEVAHDFNNLLQVVLGNCERLMLRHPAGDPAYRDLALIRENAQRAANMTKQLLAFSRKQTLKREVVSITEILRDFARFLSRAVGEKVKIDLVNGRNLPNVRADKNQLETAIMNLAVNARDAMAPDGGVLTIRTAALSADEVKALGVAGLSPRDHLLIEVADTGPGVPKEIQDKIFDPFFTTKEEGKGTGLGLSTVHGIIGQMDGAITVGDAEGGGARFRIYLPAFDGEIEAAATPAPSPADLTGVGRILVVEDEDAVRNFVVAALQDCGYSVTSVADGIEALERLAGAGETFDLVISDVMMPEIDGPTLVARARVELGCEAKVVFMSAYAEAGLREQLDAIEGAAYLQKPFTLKGLAAKVKETLSGTPQA